MATFFSRVAGAPDKSPATTSPLKHGPVVTRRNAAWAQRKRPFGGMTLTGEKNLVVRLNSFEEVIVGDLTF